MTTTNYIFSEGEEVKIRVDPDATKLMVVSLHTQNGGNSYTVSNGLYTGIHCEYELESLSHGLSQPRRVAGFGSKKEKGS